MYNRYNKYIYIYIYIYNRRNIYAIQDNRKRLYAFVYFNTISNDKIFTHLSKWTKSKY